MKKRIRIAAANGNVKGQLANLLTSSALLECIEREIGIITSIFFLNEKVAVVEGLNGNFSATVNWQNNLNLQVIQ